MNIVREACAGSLESSDAMVFVKPSASLAIEIDSVVRAQFGDAIEKTVRDTVAALAITNASIRVQDRGALDCVIAARVETALKRGCVS